MTKKGGRITVSKSVVTGIRIDSRNGQLIIEGVDQDKDGGTLRAHTIAYDVEATDIEREPPVDVEKAIKRIRQFAQTVIDEA